jgi:hypothetical protein
MQLITDKKTTTKKSAQATKKTAIYTSVKASEGDVLEEDPEEKHAVPFGMSRLEAIVSRKTSSLMDDDDDDDDDDLEDDDDHDLDDDFDDDIDPDFEEFDLPKSGKSPAKKKGKADDDDDFDDEFRDLGIFNDTFDDDDDDF